MLLDHPYLRLQHRHLPTVVVIFLFFTNGPRDVRTTVSTPAGYFKDFTAPNGTNIDFVLKGDSSSVNCVPNSVNKVRIEEPIYTWSNSTEYKDINLRNYPEWSVRGEVGILGVKNAQPKQTGKYYCSVRSRVKKSEPVIFEHIIAIYQLPIYTMKWMVYHLTKSCDKQTRFKKYTDEIMKVLCGGQVDCVWSIKLDTCIASGADLSQEKWQTMKTWIQGKQSDLIVSFEMRLKVAKDFRVPECDLTCMTQNVKHHLELEYKPKLEAFRSTNRDAFRDSLDMTFMEKSMKQTLSLVCPEGYEQYKTEVCIPCFSGTAKEGLSDEKCIPCGYFSYQPLFATKKCEACPIMMMIGKRGASNKSDCTWYYQSIVFWLIVILVLVAAAGPCAVIGFCCMKWKNSSSDSGRFFQFCDRCCGFGKTIKPPEGEYRTTKDKKTAPDVAAAAAALPVLFEEAPGAKKKGKGKQLKLAGGKDKKKDTKKDTKKGTKKDTKKGAKKGKEDKSKQKKGKATEATTEAAAVPPAFAAPPGFADQQYYYDPYAAQYPGYYPPPPPPFFPPPPSPQQPDPMMMMMMMAAAEEDDDDEK